MIVCDASSLVGAATGADSVPKRAVQKALAEDRFALSTAVFDEIVNGLHRPRLARFIDSAHRSALLDILVPSAVWFESSERVIDCRDIEDNKSLELALAASASAIVSSDADLLVLHPWRAVRICSPIEYLTARN